MKFIKSKIVRVAVVFAVILAVIYAIFRFTPYPQLKKFLSRNYSTRIYDAQGELLQILPLENGLRREWTDYEDIPAEVKKYFLVAEDKRFFLHSGVDFGAILVAFKQNLTSKRTVRGASTITMQLVKIISPEIKQSSTAVSNPYLIKLRDIFNAFRLETRLSKKQILELYLNNVPFGLNCEGVTTAARTIFSKELNQLSPEEICCLAVIPRRPSANNPLINPEICVEKANLLYQRVNKTKTDINCSSFSRFEYPQKMPHYINYLKKEINPMPAELHLAADLELFNYTQHLAMQALQESQNSRISNASVLVLDNENNSVLCWLGNANWFDEEHSGQVDGVLALNQPGSSMKPFLYAVGLEHGYNPSSVLADVPKEFGNSNVYIPANFNNRFNGPVRYRVALASSLNIPAVSILDDVGVPLYLQYLEKLGFESLKNTGVQADLGLALGAGEVSLKELATAFSVFTRDGKYIPLTYELDAPKGKSIQIYEKDTSRIIAKFLSDTSARAKGFGYTQTFETKYPSIFKTGTSNQYQNIVALGATPKWTVAVWMGNFSGETVIGKTGSSLPASIAKQVLDYLMSSPLGKFCGDFPEPDEYELHPVCLVSGMEPSKYCNSIVYEYFKVKEKYGTCDWHTGYSDGYVNYPSEYQQWFRLSNRNGGVNYSDSDLYILSPNNDSVFFYDPSNKERLAITVEATGGYEEFLTIEYDGKYYKKIGRPFVFDLPMELGFHKVKLYCGPNIQELTFEVR